MLYFYFGQELRLNILDEEWTQEETDYLFSLVKEYDMRFYIVADRYEYPKEPCRSLEVIVYTFLAMLHSLTTIAGYESALLQRLS